MKTQWLLAVVAAAGLSVLCGCSQEGRIQRTLEKAEVYRAEGQNDRAEIAYLSVLRMDPNRPGAVSGLGRVYCDQGRWAHAITALLRVREVAPDDTESRSELAMLLFLGGDLNAARDESLEVLLRQPSNDEAVLVLASTSVQPDQIAAARRKIAELEVAAGRRAVFHLAEAAFLLRESRPDLAEAEARKAVQADPDSAAAYVMLSNILKTTGRASEARDALRQSYELAELRSARKLVWPTELIEGGEVDQAKKLLLDVHGQAPDFLPVTLLLAQACFRQGQMEDSEGWVNKVLEADETNPEARLLQARITLNRGEFAEALEILNRLAKQSPEALRVNYELARAHYLAGDLPASLTTLERLLHAHPESVPVRLLLAQVYLVRNDPASAIRVVTPLLQVDPDYRSALLLLAEARRQTGEVEPAAVIYQRLVEANPEDIEALYRLGQVLLIQGKRDEARETFEAVLKLEPSNLPAMALLADLDVRQQDLPAAAERLKAQVDRDPQSVGARFLLGQVYLAQRDYPAAETQFGETIRLAPTFQPAYLLLVRSYKAGGRSEEAKKELNALLQVHPQDTAALLLLAAMAEAEGNWEPAGRRYEQVLSIDPGNLMALNNLAYMQLEHSGDLDRALELASTARKRAPQAASVTDTFGWVLFHRGEFPRALLLLREAAAQSGANAEVVYHLGMAAYMNDQEDLARQCFQSVLNLEPQSAHQDEMGRRLEVMGIQPGARDAQSLAQLRQALAEQPADPVALKRLAARYERGEDTEPLIQLYEQALAKAPDSVSVLVQYAGVCLDVVEQQEKAMTLARSARRLAPQDPYVAHTLGKLAYRAADYSWAAGLLGESAARQPAKGAVQFDAAQAYYAVGRLDEAATAMQASLGGDDPAVDRARASAFLEMLALHRTLGDPQTALLKAEKVLESAPAEVPATMVVGLASEALKQPEAAQQAYRQVLAQFPGLVPALKRLAILNAEQLGNDQAAFELGQQARQSLKDDPELNRTLGILAHARGDHAYSIQLLRESLPAYPEDPGVLYPLGFAQAELGDLKAGRQSLTKALALAPQHELSDQARQVMGRPGPL